MNHNQHDYDHVKGTTKSKTTCNSSENGRCCQCPTNTDQRLPERAASCSSVRADASGLRDQSAASQKGGIGQPVQNLSRPSHHIKEAFSMRGSILFEIIALNHFLYRAKTLEELDACEKRYNRMISWPYTTVISDIPQRILMKRCYLLINQTVSE